MPEIQITSVLSFSSEDPKCEARNVLKHESIYKWKCCPGEKQASVVLQLKEASQIHTVDIGNNGSAFVEVFVGRSSWSQGEELKVLIASSTFMSPAEAKNNKNPNRVRIFGQDGMNKNVAQEKWDRVKIVCSQPYQKDDGYGLAFVKLHSPPDATLSTQPHQTESTSVSKIGLFALRDEEPSKELSAGSFFRNRFKNDDSKDIKPTTVSIAALARDASHGQSQNKVNSSTHTPTEASRVKSIDQDVGGSPKQKSTPQKRQLPASFLSCAGAAKLKAPRPSSAKDENQYQSRKANVIKEQKGNYEEAQGSHSSENSKGEQKCAPKVQDEKPKQSPKIIAKEKIIQAVPKSPQQHSFDKLLENVMFVLSGFVNPERSDLRDKAIAMGAKYKADWSSSCTHLICAFRNTPKATQVKALGKGRIVSKKWINDSYYAKKRLPTSKYCLETCGTSSEDEEEEESLKASVVAKSSRSTKRKFQVSTPASSDDSWIDDASSSSDCDTEDELNRLNDAAAAPPLKRTRSINKPKPSSQEGTKDSAPSSSDLPALPDFFQGSHFLLYGKFKDEKRRKLTRFITAYNGFVDDYMSDDTNIVLSDDLWDDNFDQAHTDNPKLVFCGSDWVVACHEDAACVSQAPYIMKPPMSAN